MRPDHIIIHCSDTDDTRTISWGVIRRYHVEKLGFQDIGYHFGVEQVGDNFEAMVGRTPDRMGAHCKAQGMNTHSIGVCIVGRFDYAPPPPDQLSTAAKLCHWLSSIYYIPIEHILGHNHFDSRKTCPGRMFDIAEFQKLVWSNRQQHWR